jgi:hypothetical protein
MSKDFLDTYLNDHLAGSIAALELIDHLIETNEGNGLHPFLTAMRLEIEADQSVLRGLMRDLGVDESVARKAGAWIIEKFGRAKFQLGWGDDALGLFQALEGLALGISGKRALWEALSTAADPASPLGKLDYTRLIGRATEQFEGVNARRLDLAYDILSRGAARPVRSSS